MSKPQTEAKQAQPTKSTEELFSDTNVTMKTGRLVKDAETISDGKFVRIRLATNKEYLDAKGELQSTTNYFNALVSSNLSDAFSIAQDLKKGDWIYLKGEDGSQSFDTPEGYKQTAVTTFAYKVVLKHKQEQSDQSEANAQTSAPSP